MMAGGVSISRVVAGVNRVVMGASRVVVGVNRVVVGVSRVVAGASRVLVGVNRVVAGVNRVVMGASRVVAGVNRVVAGANRVVARANRVVAEASRVVAERNCPDAVVSTDFRGALSVVASLIMALVNVISMKIFCHVCVFYYLCTRNTRRILRGAWALAQAEIIPTEPETGNADAGKTSP